MHESSGSTARTDARAQTGGHHPVTHGATVGNLRIGNGAPLTLIAGPCVIEDREMILHTAARIVETARALAMPLVFKSSFKKANRTSISGFTGIGRDEALHILQDVRTEFDVPVVTDVHDVDDVAAAAQVADMLQIPAFLCRQTDLLLAAGATGRAVNIKKGQFLAPEDMSHAAAKVASTGNQDILLCERGSSFGYHNLVVDMRGLVIMRALGYPVVMDATHSVQIPSQGAVSGGRPEFIAPLARAAAAVGIDALFIETHPDPSRALSDAGSQLPLARLSDLLVDVLSIDRAFRSVIREKED
ncbi:MAG: 3-deoxy-8-phosphooctulonate synthase [Bacteroidota bacterium]|jgi:2-dehydro-3-deoxyphosphooctonate aldolase (KDO 8-P synthase)|nr:3-deoxy-8-phosphooctulonate synthase [Bacteroidota bacterium]